jgi:hypothetical protein
MVNYVSAGHHPKMLTTICKNEKASMSVSQSKVQYGIFRLPYERYWTVRTIHFPTRAPILEFELDDMEKLMLFGVEVYHHRRF